MYLYIIYYQSSQHSKSQHTLCKASADGWRHVSCAFYIVEQIHILSYLPRTDHVNLITWVCDALSLEMFWFYYYAVSQYSMRFYAQWMQYASRLELHLQDNTNLQYIANL